MNNFTREQAALVIAGLRLLQDAVDQNSFPPGIEDIATDDGQFTLDADDISNLCEAINCSPEPQPAAQNPAIDPATIKIYAVYSPTSNNPDDTPIGYSLDDKPGSAEQQNRHAVIDPLNPGADLHLLCFPSSHHAAAFVEGLQFFRPDTCGTVTRTFSPGLTAVLAECYDSAEESLTIHTEHWSPAATP